MKPPLAALVASLGHSLLLAALAVHHFGECIVRTGFGWAL